MRNFSNLFAVCFLTALCGCSGTEGDASAPKQQSKQTGKMPQNSSSTKKSETKPKVSSSLVGYWEVQSVTANGKPDQNEKGGFLILRANGTFRMAKRGRKPAGKWEVKGEKLLLTVTGKPTMPTDWKLTGDELTLDATQGKNRVILKYRRVKLDKEPKAPDEDV